MVLLATGIFSLLTIARIEQQVSALRRLDEAVGLARALDYSIVAQEHLSSMFVLTAEEPYYDKLRAERERFRTTTATLATHGLPPVARRAIVVRLPPRLCCWASQLRRSRSVSVDSSVCPSA